MTEDPNPTDTSDGAETPVPRSLARIDGPESAALATLTGVFDDLQYVLTCCEQLVAALDRPGTGAATAGADHAVVEALWTGALVGYVRCFSGRTGVLTDQDVEALDLGEQTMAFHAALKKLRDHYASRHTNPRETITVGVVLAPDGAPQGVAVTSSPNPPLDPATVRSLGRIAYGLSGTIDTRIQQAQAAVLDAATAMPHDALQRLPHYEVAS